MYKYKSGALERKEKIEKDAKEVKGRISITNFFKSTSKTDVLVHNDSSMPHLDHVAIFDTDETNIDSTSNNDSNSCESEPNKLISPTLVASLDLKDPGMWPTTISRSVRDCCAPKFPELVDFVKYMPKDINGKSFSKFMLYTKSSNNRESFPRDWLIWSKTKQSLHCLPCILFHKNLTETSNSISILAKREGFCPHKTPWKKLYSKLPTHENSYVHSYLFLEWKILQQSLIGMALINILLKNKSSARLTNGRLFYLGYSILLYLWDQEVCHFNEIILRLVIYIMEISWVF